MITIVLHQPKNPGNIGAVARVCKNFGAKLIIVEPRCDPLANEAQKRATHALDLLNNVRIETLDVLSEFDSIIATSARIGDDDNLSRAAIAPKELSLPTDSNVAVLFGPEDFGLSNDTLARAHITVRIPTTDFSSLNLSHAVTIILYELSRDAQIEKPVAAKKEELAILGGLIDETIDSMTVAREEMRETQKKTWRKVLGRAFLSQRETANFMGFFKNILGRR